ncbi:hypothetical protein [Endozoicomonas sp. ISHI1]|uniref:hypothetical protein n=1 Tax=Endozoicomonas sp. ISHI1 TaxID=2825882 RepID=UPI0021497F15|nr:hypothetical protein [Endozoicomonas sp. ISHI1]
MKLVVFGFTLLHHLLPVCYAVEEYESIFWDWPLFSHEVNTTLYVRLGSQINIICPNFDIVTKKRVYYRQAHTMYDNAWLVYNKTSYDDCRVDNKYDPDARIFLCKDPLNLIRLKLPFYPPEYSQEPGDEAFEGGKDYYLISTSDGSESSINRREGGHCLTHNMRIRIHICKESGDPDPSCLGPFDPESNICPATDPVADLYHATTLAPVTTPVPVNISKIYNETDSDTATVTKTVTKTVIAKATEAVPTGYNYSLARPIELVWEIGYNQTRTEHISEAAHHPVVALCEESNSKVSLLNDKGVIVDSWLCQHAGERLVILKPEYRNSDVYLFEALPEYGSVRLWKSTLTVNVGSIRQRLINQANSLYNPPGFALLVAMYLVAASML